MQKRFIVIFGILLILLMPFIHADIGPFVHRAASLEFFVKYDNQTIEEDFRADILICSQESCTHIDNTDECVQGLCSFSYYRIERVPSEMRLQVSLHDKTFTSGTFNFSETKSLRKYYYDVNINPNGKMMITGPNEEIRQHNKLQSYSSVLFPFVCALILTILIELIVLILFLRRWKVKKWKKPLLTVVIANVISVPLVWVIFLVLVAVLASILLAIVIAEAFAVVFEAYALFFFNKKILPLKKSFILGIVMNAASFVVGIILAFLIF